MHSGQPISLEGNINTNLSFVYFTEYLTKYVRLFQFPDISQIVNNG